MDVVPPIEEYTLSVGQVAKRYTVNRKTVFRWMTRGLKTPGGAIRLDYRVVGGRHKTSPRAVEAFHAARNAGVVGVPLVRTPAERKVAVEAAMRQMEAMGVKFVCAGSGPG